MTNIGFKKLSTNHLLKIFLCVFVSFAPLRLIFERKRFLIKRKGHEGAKFYFSFRRTYNNTNPQSIHIFSETIRF